MQSASKGLLLMLRSVSSANGVTQAAPSHRHALCSDLRCRVSRSRRPHIVSQPSEGHCQTFMMEDEVVEHGRPATYRAPWTKRSHPVPPGRPTARRPIAEMSVGGWCLFTGPLSSSRLLEGEPARHISTDRFPRSSKDGVEHARRHIIEQETRTCTSARSVLYLYARPAPAARISAGLGPHPSA